MNQNNRCVAACLLALGCAAEIDGTGDVGQDGVEETLLAEVTLGEGHTIRFLEAFPGAVTIAEIAPDLATAITVHLEPRSLADTYRSLGVAIDPEVVERLEQAQARVDRANAEVEGDGPPPEFEAPTASLTSTGGGADGRLRLQAEYTSQTGPHPDDTAEVFERVYCNAEEYDADDQLCGIDVTSADTGFIADTSYLRSIVINTASSGKTKHELRRYVCVDRWPIIGCVRRDWRTTTTQNVSVGHYGIFTDTFHWTRARASGNQFRIGAIWYYL